MTNRLPVSCSSLGSNRPGRKMKRLPILCLTGIFLVGWSQTSGAQEAVSNTSEGSTTSSTGAPASASSTGAFSAGTSGTGPTSVSNAPSAAGALQGGPGSVGVFTPTPVKIYASISGGYDDNLSTIPGNKQSSAFTSGNVILDYTFGDPRLQLVVNAGGGGTYYYSHLSTQDYDIDLKGALALTYKASPRLTLGGSILVSYLTEPSFQYAGGINSRNGNYLYTTDKAFLEYAWSRRFSTKTSYTFEAFNYDKNSVGTFSDRISDVFGNEFRLQMVPTTGLILEYRYGIVSYQNSFLNSETHYALGGFDHTFNPRLMATFRGGAEFRSYDNDGDRTGPYFEGNLTYALGRRTSLSWVNRYGIEEPDIPNSQSRTTFRTGLQTKFNATSRIEAALELYYVRDDYHAFTTGPVTNGAFTEDTYDAGFTVKYAINSMFAVQLGYHYTDVTSGSASREYSRNRVSGGVNLTF